jgi:hypothetical protein
MASASMGIPVAMEQKPTNLPLTCGYGIFRDETEGRSTLVITGVGTPPGTAVGGENDLARCVTSGFGV